VIFDLKHITVKEFFSLDESEADKYLKLEEMLKVKNDMFGKYKATPLGELTFGDVGNIKKNLSEASFDSLFDCFKIIYNVKLGTYLSSDIVDYFYSMKWIKEEIVKLIENQRKVLKAEEDPLLKMADPKNRLGVFDELPTLIILGRSFGEDPEVIENWKYNKVFSILAYDKIHGEVQKRYNELKYKK